MDNPFKNLTRTQLYLVLGGGALIAGYAEYSHHKKTGSWSPFASATVNTAAGTGIDPITQMPYADDSVTDPQTGEGYLQEAEQYGSVQAAEASVSQYGQSTATGSGIPVNPASPASSGSVNTTVGTSIYTSDSAWAQAVEAGLSSVSGSASYDGTDIGTAIGAYLQGEPVTPAQASVISVAIAEYGNPPVGTFQIIPANTTATGTTTTTPGSFTIPIPNGQLGWETITFPTAQARDQFNTWLTSDPAAAKRSAINAKIVALGGTGEIPEPSGPVTSAPSPSPQNTGNPLDYQ